MIKKTINQDDDCLKNRDQHRNFDQSMTASALSMSVHPEVQGFYHEGTGTISYIVKDPESMSCAIIDSVLDFDYAAGRVTFDQADLLIERIREQGLALEWIIETHAHADHLSAAPYIKKKLGGKIGIGQHITQVQNVFGKIFNEANDFSRDGSQFDALFADGQTYRIGKLQAFVLATPGHTPACMTHVIGDAAFVGDTLFMPDGGSARADFPGGDASILYDSIQRLLNLPEAMRLFMCHDYCPDGRAAAWETTVAEEKHHNIHVGGGVQRDQFIKMRTQRDQTLGMPDLIIPSIQVNMRAGHLPEDADGNLMLKVPINAL